MTVEAAIPLFRQPRVAIVDGAVVLYDLEVTDPAAVALVERRRADGADPADAIVDAIGIGVRVLDREQAAADTEYVRAEFERAAGDVERAFADKARVVADHFGKKVDEVFAADSGVVARVFEKHFADGSSEAVQHQVRKVVDEVLARSREDLLRQFSSADGLLADFKRGVTESVNKASERSDASVRAVMARMAELQVELEKLRGERAKRDAVEVEAERGTAKGRTFEAAIADAVDELARAKGDDCDAVGDHPGAGGKKGDVVVAVDGAAGPARGRVVFEAKDRQLSKKAALAELDQALITRDAGYGVLVVPSEGTCRPAPISFASTAATSCSSSAIRTAKRARWRWSSPTASRGRACSRPARAPRCSTSARSPQRSSGRWWRWRTCAGSSSS